MFEAVQTFVENCKTEDQIKTINNLVGGRDSWDPKINTCFYVMKKGNSNGQLCGKPSKTQIRSKHTKRVYHFESQSQGL